MKWIKKAGISFIILTMLTSFLPNVFSTDSAEVSASTTDPYRTKFNGGTGTKEDPYLVAYGNQLLNIGDVATDVRPVVYYKLVNDINMGGWIWQALQFKKSDGSKEYNSNNFEFHLDGNGKTISLNQVRYSTLNPSGGGFFELITPKSSVHDLNLKINYTDGNYQNSGALAATNYGTIRNVHILKGETPLYPDNPTDVLNGRFGTDMVAQGTTSNIGGLVGINSGTIENSSSELNIKAVGSSNTNRISNVGGLVGYNSGVIRNSHATGVLKLKYASVIGGLVGQNEGKIYASSYTGRLQYVDDITPAHQRYTSNLDHFGGLVGRQGMNGDGALTAYSYSTTSVGSYYDNNAANGPDVFGGLIGHLSGGKVLHNYATGSEVFVFEKTGTTPAVGALIGKVEKVAARTIEVKDNYALGTLSKPTRGLVGIQTQSGANAPIYESNYYVTSPNSTVTNEIGTAIANRESSKNKASYPTFDFENIWKLEVEGTDSPTLRGNILYGIDIRNKNNEVWINSEYFLVLNYLTVDSDYEFDESNKPALEWSISNSNHGMTIDADTGLITTPSTPQSVLTATVTAKLKNNPQMLTTTTVTLVPPSVKEVKLTTTIPVEKALRGSNTYTIRADIKTEGTTNAFSWETSDPNITIDSQGKVNIGENTVLGDHYIRAVLAADENYNTGNIFTFKVVDPYLEITELKQNYWTPSGLLKQDKGISATYSAKVKAVGNIAETIKWEIYSFGEDEQLEKVNDVTAVNGTLTIGNSVPMGTNYILRAVATENPLSFAEWPLAIGGVTAFSISHDNVYLVPDGYTEIQFDVTAENASSGEHFNVEYADEIEEGTEYYNSIYYDEYDNQGYMYIYVGDLPKGTYTLNVSLKSNPAQTQSILVHVLDRISGIDIVGGDRRLTRGQTINLVAKPIHVNENLELSHYVEWEYPPYSYNYNGVYFDPYTGQLQISEYATFGDYTFKAMALGFEKTVTITVTDSLVYDLSITPSAVYVIPGQSYKFNHSIDAAENADLSVTWSSNHSDVEVATSQDGTITVSEEAEAGNRIVTVTSNEDSNVTATATVHIMDVHAVNVSQEALILNQGEEASVTATVSATNGVAPNINEVEWSSNSPENVIIDSQSGEITIPEDASSGSYTVTATSIWDPTVSATILVDVTEISGITISGDKKAFAGETKAVLATVAGSEKANKEVMWSSNYNKITIDSSGQLLVAEDAEPGLYTITATSKKDARRTATYEFEVVKVNSVTIADLEDEHIFVGESSQLSVTVDVIGTISEDVVWSTTEVGISISETGLFSVNADASTGRYTIRATSVEDTTKYDEITIIVIKLEELEVTSTKTVIHQNSSSSLLATMTLDDGDEGFTWTSENKNIVTWSSHDESGKVSVNSDGLVTVAADASAGTYIVTATFVHDTEVYANISIHVTAIDHISITPEYTSLLAGGTTQLTAEVEVLVPNGVLYEVPRTVVWSTEDLGDNIAVSATGLVTVATGALPGEYKVKATSTVDSTKFAYTTIEVVGINSVTIIPIPEYERYLMNNQTLQLEASVTKIGNITENVVWSSEASSKVTVSPSGLVTVGNDAEPGEYIITATSAGDATKKDTITITVFVIKQLTVSKDEIVLHQGENETVSADLEIYSGGNTPIIWSSNTLDIVEWSTSDSTNKVTVIDGVITVDMDAQPGEYTITATSTQDSSIYDSVKVTVTAVTGVSVTPQTVTLWEGISEQLTANVTVFGDVAKDVVWSSDSPTAIAVNQMGEVTVLPNAAAGMYTVKATSTVDPRHYGEATIFVAVINGVIINKNVVWLQAGESEQLHAAGSIEGTVTKDVYWISEHEEITVDPTGMVTVSANAEPKDYNIKAILEINPAMFTEAIIKVFEVQKIILNVVTTVIHQGNSTTASANAEVVNGNENSGDVIWSSSDERAVKVANGVVTVLSDALPGEYTITATSAHNAAITASTTITVTAVLDVNITAEKTVMNRGESQILSASVNVYGDIDRSVLWTSSNNDMVQVSQDGEVTVLAGASAGNYTITATSVTDSSKKAQIIITVTSPYVPTSPVIPEEPKDEPVDDSTNKEETNQNEVSEPAGLTVSNENVNPTLVKDAVISKVQQLLEERNNGTTNSSENGSTGTAEKQFSDVSGHWSENVVKQAVYLGFVNGYGDGSFNPNGVITRAEFSTIIARVFGLNTTNSSASFSDVDNHWAKSAIQALVAAGIVSGNGDGGFAPDREITREEMIIMLSRIVNFQAVAVDTAKGNFADLAEASSYATDAIKAAAQAGIIGGKGNNMFDPKGEATRAEALTIIMNVLKLDPEMAAALEKLLG